MPTRLVACDHFWGIAVLYELVLCSVMYSAIHYSIQCLSTEQNALSIQCGAKVGSQLFIWKVLQ